MPAREPDCPVPPAAELQQLLRSLIDPILSIDANGIVESANPAVSRVFGWHTDDLIGENIRVLMGEPYRSEHDGYIQNFLRTGEKRAIGRVRQVLGRRRDGSEFPCELSVSQVRTADGPRFYGIVRDVSERQALAARLAQVERLAATGELAAGIAHEINNPVNTIVNCAQLVRDGDDDPTLLDDIVSEGMRIATIVRDLLDFAREGRAEHVSFELGDVVRRARQLVERRFEKQAVRVEFNVPDDLPALRGRPHQIQQVLLNVLLNARDALIGQDGADGLDKRIRLDAQAIRHGDRVLVEIRVRDNGPGIPSEDLERVFNPFFTKRKSGGTGLGLAVSKGIIDEHAGSFAAHSVVGEYAEFVIVLPAHTGA